ncbi:MAG: hypothetical protein ABI794_14605 [Betaproteobacteria bacterium]
MRHSVRNLALGGIKLLLFMTVVASATLVPDRQSHAGIITVSELITVTGTVTQIIQTQIATGQVTVTPPGGPPMVLDMPAGGGTIRIPVAGHASSFATVNLATGRTSFGWAHLGGGYTAQSTADIHTLRTITSVTSSTTIQRTTQARDPNEIDTVYFSPGVDGSINVNMSLTDNTSGTLLFDSTSELTSASPDVVYDSTGLLTWTRTPGFFDGEEGDLNGLPNQFSNNRWALDLFSLSFDIPVALNPGDTYASDIAGLFVSSGSISGGSGVIGLGSRTIPEPGTAFLVGAALCGLLSSGWRRKERLFTKSRGWIAGTS